MTATMAMQQKCPSWKAANGGLQLGTCCLQELGRQLEAAAAEAVGQQDVFSDELLLAGTPEGAGRMAPTPLPGLQVLTGRDM